MKKGLMTTSALVAAGMFGLAGHANAQMKHMMNPVQLKVGGYMEQFVGVALQRPDNRVRSGVSGIVDEQTEAEVHFTGQARLDNGLQIRAHVEYEVAGSPGNLVDEETLTLRNGFGQVILGNDDPVSSLMTTGYMTPFVTTAGGNLTYDVTPWIPLPSARSTGVFGSQTAGALIDSKLESFDSDANKITYVSPRIGGLQVGASYVPDGSQQLWGSGNAVLARGLPSQDGAGWSDGWALATNYTFAVDAFKVGVAAGYEQANGSGNGTTTSANNPWQLGGGVRIDYGPFRVNAGYKRVSGLDSGDISGTDTQSGPSAGHNQNGHMWMAGLLYTFGANAVSLDWQRGTEGGLNGAPDPEALTLINAAYGRHLAPGILADLNLMYANYTGQDVAGVPGNRGWAVVSSIRLDF